MPTIDVWNVDTFDAELMAELECEADLICAYTKRDKDNFRRRYIEKDRDTVLSNPHTYPFQQFVERIIFPLMQERTIRGWHHTRLTYVEVQLIQRLGVYPSTLATIKHRLDSLVEAGDLSKDQADALFAGSPFHHHEQTDARSNKFWMTANPLPITDGGIELFFKHWGGEGVYFWQRDKALVEAISSIGQPRVIELATPLKITTRAFGAAQAVVAYYGRSLGHEPDGADFEFFTTQSLGPEAVLAIHTQGDPNFKQLAKGYPPGFVAKTE